MKSSQHRNAEHRAAKSILPAFRRATLSAPLFLLAFAPLVCAPLGAVEPSNGPLVIVGGGTTPAGLHRKLLELGGGTNAHVLVIPHASAVTNAGASSVEAFRKAGAARVANLTTTNVAEALAAVRAAEVIWFPGGDQTRLMAELNRLGVVTAIRERHAVGAVIGGTSAGAAVMSKVMITGSPKTPGEVPPLAEGLGLWPGAIVDQHFSQRKREPRLRAAVSAHPGLMGVGIDESTYVIARTGTAEVSGQHSVTLVTDLNGTGKQSKKLKSGDSFPTRPKGANTPN